MSVEHEAAMNPTPAHQPARVNWRTRPSRTAGMSFQPGSESTRVATPDSVRLARTRHGALGRGFPAQLAHQGPLPARADLCRIQMPMVGAKTAADPLLVSQVGDKARPPLAGRLGPGAMSHKLRLL